MALFLLPLAEKSIHEFGHLHEVACNISESHYCEAEHNCEYCDFLATAHFSISQTQTISVFNDWGKQIYSPFKFISVPVIKDLSFFLRGPPNVV